MPTYEYECKSCGHRFEKFQNMTDKPLSNCPKCKKAVRRIIGQGAGIIFKGKGFYATDYRKAPPASPPAPVKPSCQGCPGAAHNHN